MTEEPAQPAARKGVISMEGVNSPNPPTNMNHGLSKVSSAAYWVRVNHLGSPP
jgi:hypothetical protein